MRVSVVVCSHTIARFDELTEAVESLLAQTHDDLEIVGVADGDSVQKRIASLVRRPSVEKVLQLATLLLFTGVIGVGYRYAWVTVRST